MPKPENDVVVPYRVEGNCLVLKILDKSSFQICVRRTLEVGVEGLYHDLSPTFMPIPGHEYFRVTSKAQALLHLVFVISIGTGLLWFWLLGRGEASVVSGYLFLAPILGLIFASLTLGEQFTLRDGGGTWR